MEGTENQLSILNNLANDLARDVSSVRTGELEISTAKAISQLSGKAINAIAKGVMLQNHHEIQLMKVKNTADRTIAMSKTRK
jgi:hypothetical protein